MPHVVISGGPGAGKTTLLAELATMGWRTVAESARAIIAERIARGLAPRPEPLEFAREILRRDIEKYLAHPVASDWVFFDRSAVEGIAMVHELASLAPPELAALRSRYAFHRTVFMLPPWEAVYRTDAERDHGFAHAERVHRDLVRCHRTFGYRVHSVPRLAASERAQHVLRVLARGDA